MKIVISVLLIFLAFATLAKSESRYGGWPENDTKSQSEMLRELMT